MQLFELLLNYFFSHFIGSCLHRSLLFWEKDDVSPTLTVKLFAHRCQISSLPDNLPLYRGRVHPSELGDNDLSHLKITFFYERTNEWVVL